MNLIISLTTHSSTYMFIAMRTMSSTHVTMAKIAKNMNFEKKRGKKNRFKFLSNVEFFHFFYPLTLPLRQSS